MHYGLRYTSLHQTVHPLHLSHPYMLPSTRSSGVKSGAQYTLVFWFLFVKNKKYEVCTFQSDFSYKEVPPSAGTYLSNIIHDLAT